MTALVDPGSSDSLPTRRSLLSRLRNHGDQRSWHEFHQMYRELIYNFAVRRGLTDVEAKEVVQETMISVAKTIGSFQYDNRRCSFKNWLRHLAGRRIVDQFRARARKGANVISLADPALREIADTSPGTANEEPDAAWEYEWQERLMRRALDHLRETANPKHFRIFHCLVEKGMKPREVADALQVSMALVYVARHRMTSLLKREVKLLERQSSAGVGFVQPD